MGTFGTGISSNDVYEDITDEFYTLYDEGKDVATISKKLIATHQDYIKSHEDQYNFWITLAKCQWECKALDPVVFDKIKDIVESGKDLELWKALDASQADINKRKKVLENFLAKITTEKKSPRKLKTKKFKDAIYERGDCLILQLSDGNYTGVFVLEAEKESEFGLNLIAETTIKKAAKPSLKDFENTTILYRLQQGAEDWIPKESISWYYAKDFKKATTEFEKIGQLTIDKTYDSSKDFQSFSNWDNIKSFQDYYYANIEKLKCDVTVSLESVRFDKKQPKNTNSIWEKIKAVFTS